MKRAEFLERLMQALAFMTAEERRSVREYYEELLDDALEAGEAEEAVLAGFGAPEEIAQQSMCRRNLPARQPAAPRRHSRRQSLFVCTAKRPLCAFLAQMWQSRR